MTLESIHMHPMREPIGDKSTRKKILVVDNHPVALNMIANLLRKQGHQVQTAKDGLAALDILKEWTPDVIFIDLVMPNIGGEKLCRIIRKFPLLSDVYIVIVSAVAVEEVKNITAFGADACIAKGPFKSMGKNILDVLERFDRMSTGHLTETILGREHIDAREITRELLWVKDHFEVILSRMDEGILEITDAGRVVYANPAALTIIGKPEEAVLASNFIDFFDANDRQRIQQVLELPGTAPKRFSEDDDLKLCGKDITIDFFQITDSEKKLIAMIKDVSERKQLKAQILNAAEQAKKMAVEAEAANVAKSTFLAVMSHEIRTPMNAVIGFTDMLFDAGLPEEQLEYANTIKQSGELLLTLINDILDFSKIEAGQLDLESIDFDPEITAYHVCDLIRPQVLKKPVKILCRMGRDVPGFVNGDPGRFRQVLINLMSNAAKFTESGEIELMLDVEKEDAARIKLHATVRDTGDAIPPEILNLIFDVFEQGDTSTTRRYGGTGLGLSICRRIAALMNGKVWAESEKGKGNIFHFTAWLNKSQNKHDKIIRSALLPGKKVLIVDANKTHLEILEHMLESAGMRVARLLDGRKVVPTLQTAIQAHDPFDCCILDIDLGDVSGYKIAEQIRHPDSQIASIALLAFSLPVERRARQCLQAGFDGFLPTPIRRDRLIEMMIRLLGQERVEGGKRTEPEPRQLVTQYSIREEIKHAVWILLAEDNVMSQKLATLMLKKAGYQVMVAANGREVINEYINDPDKFSLIFMDIQMPEIDGLEATQTIRQWEKERALKQPEGARRIPIVALTANAMKGDRERCLSAGMDDYAPKPIERDVVFAMVKKWVRTSEAKKIGRDG